MERTYSATEIRELFGDRCYYSDMSTDQLNHVAGYMAKKIQIEEASMREMLLNAKECEHTDADIYLLLEKLSRENSNKSNAEVSMTDQLLDQEKIHRVYKRMCRDLAIDLKYEMHTIMNTGTNNKHVLQHLQSQFRAKGAIGSRLNPYIPSENKGITDYLKTIRDESIDITICNKTLSGIPDEDVSAVVDQIARLTAKYIIIRDFSLQENFNLSKEMILEKELQEGILQESRIPDMIEKSAGDEYKQYPCDFYNSDFSLDAEIKAFKRAGFDVAFQPSSFASMGNVQIVVLKRNTFNHPSECSSSVALPLFRAQFKRSGGSTADEDSLKGKAFIQSKRSAVIREACLLLNKLLDSNIKRIVPAILSVMQSGDMSDIEELAQKIVTKAKSDQFQLNALGILCKHLSTQHPSFASAIQQHIFEQVTTLANSEESSTGDFMKRYAEMQHISRFVAHVCRYKFLENKVAVVDVITQAVNIYPEMIHAMVSQLVIEGKSPSLLDHLIQTVNEALSSNTHGRIRCILLNTIACSATEEE